MCGGGREGKERGMEGKFAYAQGYTSAASRQFSSAMNPRIEIPRVCKGG